MTKVRFSQIKPRSLVDGAGERTVVFFQGCPLHCKGCQNKALWDFQGGYQADTNEVLETLTLIGNPNITISGGEPFAQPLALLQLVRALKVKLSAHIIVYTGYTLDELLDVAHPAQPYVKEILSSVDILVDGRFIAELDDPFINYRGSRNQRVIDVTETAKAGEIVTLDWDTPELILDLDGDLLAPIGLASLVDMGGGKKTARRCGETRKNV